MSIIENLSRRRFLKNTGAGVLVIGTAHLPLSFSAQVQAASMSVQPNLFVKVDIDGTVTITSVRAEMGQGVRTGLPMILADEMEADWERVALWQAPGDPTKYDPAGKDSQNTDGSRSTRHHFTIMRELGAAARYVLERAAAEQLGVPFDEVTARNHRLHHEASGRSLDFGEVVETAAGIDVPTADNAPKPALKDPSEWRYIGKDMPVFDNFDMSTGGADYGADVRLPDMLIAVVARPPVYRGKLVSFDDSEAMKVPGVSKIVEIPALADDKPAEFRALGGVAVLATNTWSAMQGRKALKIEWDDGPHGGHDSASYDDALKASSKGGGVVLRDRGDADAALAGSDGVIEADYFVHYFIHTPMEPPVALVDANSKPVRIIAPVQAPNETRQYVAEALGIDMQDVSCEQTLLGGGFGRKSKPDFVCEAAILSKAAGVPVRVQWTREDEIRNGYYHAASAHCLQGSIDASGKVDTLRYCGAWPSILGLWNPTHKTGFGIEYGMGLVDMPYDAVPNLRIENGEADIAMRIGWYRSVNNIQHAFALNSFVYELAEAAGRDPLEVMLEMIGEEKVMDLAADGVEEPWNYGDSLDEWPIMPVRLSNALRKVAELAGYGEKLPTGEAIGLAAHRSFHSYVASAVHVSVAEDGSFSVPRVDMAIDCGRYVNPEGIRKQLEGAVVYGHTVATQGKITTTAGVVDQHNFNDYPVSRMNDTPLDVRVHVLDDYVDLPPCGVGEPGVPPYAPALVNALSIATGKRVRELPIGDQLRG